MAKVTSEDLNKALNIIERNATETISAILKKRLGANGSMNLDYYCENYGEKFTFLETDDDGYGKAIHIDTIETDNNGEPTFNMIDEDEEDWGERELDDFNAQELVWILSMLEDAFYIVDDEYDGKILPKGCFEYDELEDED